mmetsp:Transcript_29326/g.28486  ORF Transcript_29326/g.28486 Transcript_29326/m.28486 type:complete len:269 (+) Transcript_29326:1249-2055(+)
MPTSKDNILDYVDKKKQKVQIVQGSKYDSTSINDVIESRRHTDQSVYTVPIVVKEGTPLYQDKRYIRSKYKPYQAKVVYESQNALEEQLLEDEETTKQPYETLSNIAYGLSLTQLPTEQIARKSEALITGTLALTIVHKDNFKESKNFVELSKEEIVEYNNVRAALKAARMKSIFKLDHVSHTSSQTIPPDQASSNQGGDTARKFMKMKTFGSKSRRSGQMSDSKKNPSRISSKKNTLKTNMGQFIIAQQFFDVKSLHNTGGKKKKKV